jgi:hypothetical protein
MVAQAQSGKYEVDIISANVTQLKPTDAAGWVESVE